jgi:acyl-coenzyme A synthetase/AMP-(fatty) acid ligase
MLNRDGALVVQGRMDRLVKRRGVFIDLDYIERVANEPLTSAEACSFEARLNDEQVIVLALGGCREMPLAEYRRNLRNKLTREMPDLIMYVAELPRTITGKLDRLTLRQMFEGGL